MSDTSPEIIYINVASEAITLSQALGHIREGRLDRAIEMLERQLDLRVMSLGRMKDKPQLTKKEDLLNTLRIVRKYRRRHPRRTDAGTASMDKTFVAAVADAQERAKIILEQID
jgi:hypothetical protein